jgi:hypothetical protein
MNVQFEGVDVGVYRADLIVDGKVIVESKVADKIVHERFPPETRAPPDLRNTSNSPDDSQKASHIQLAEARQPPRERAPR